MALTNDAHIPEDGAVFTFGKSRFEDNSSDKFWVKNDQVVNVACGDEHTAILTKSGRVFMFGSNEWGQLGIGQENFTTKPRCVKSLKHEHVVHVACGRSHTIVATVCGNIYTYGGNGEGQLGVPDLTRTHIPQHVSTLPPATYKMLSAGCDHSMALTEDGRLWVWGSNCDGQLGIERQFDVTTPTEMKLDQNISFIASGYYHSALVTENGDLYTFGEEEGGKLGLDDTVEKRCLNHVAGISDNVVSVSCGGSHTAVLNDKGKVFVFGSGFSGQLGSGVSVLESVVPSSLELPFTVTQVECGENFTALVSDTGQLYTFGDGRHGKLALGQETFSNQFSPTHVDRFHRLFVMQVSCGGCHMVVVAMPTAHCLDGDGGKGGSTYEKILWSEFAGDGKRLTRSSSARQKRRRASPMSLAPHLPALAKTEDLHWSPALKDLSNETALIHKELDSNDVEERLHGPVIVDGDLKLPIKLSISEMSGEQTFIDDDKVQDDRCLDGLDLKECEERVWKEVHSDRSDGKKKVKKKKEREVKKDTRNHKARQTKSTPDGEEGKSDNVVTNNVKGSDSKVDESAQPAKKLLFLQRAHSPDRPQLDSRPQSVDRKTRTVAFVPMRTICCCCM